MSEENLSAGNASANANTNDGDTESNYIKLQQSQMIRKNIQGISQLLNTGLNPESLDICIKLIEAGVHPQALAEVILQIRREVATLSED